ncbi:EXOSC7 [Scenedesmus sp. PABB004]|nr:EXOSC7 [Scenedesmus sp. PABB004]
MADISAGERVFIVGGIEQGVRNDGRARGDFRPLELEANVVAQADGSARLHLGSTDVLVGVKVELGSPDSARPDHGQVLVSVECSSCASPEFKGRGGEGWGIELASALEASLVGAPAGGGGLDLAALCLLPGKVAWVVYVDALVLNDGGNVLDALSIAARAALGLTRVYKVELTMDEGEDPEVELSGEREAAPLDVSAVPVIVTVSQVGARSVVDLSLEEEPCAAAALSVAVNSAARVVGVTKSGAGGLDPSLAQEMIEVAQKLAPGIIATLDAHLRSIPPAD